MPDIKPVLAALRQFAGAVTAKMSQLTAGEPEDQLRAPFETFMQEVARGLSLKVVCTGETRLPGRMGKPDYAVHATNLLAGYVELKKPGTSANPSRFTGHNREQWQRFQAIPNLIYCDGNGWGLYRSGEAARPVVRLSGDVEKDGKKAATTKDAEGLIGLLTDFLQWQPTIPTKAKGRIDLKAFADMLAPLCRMLREDVTDALKDPKSPLRVLAKDWRQLLFPDASDEQFADAYAQTVTFALLLARSEGANLHPRGNDPNTRALANAETALATEHSLLSRALQVLTDPKAQAEISASLNLLIRVIGEVPATALTGSEDPWLYFYEDFLATYDHVLRRDEGVYFTRIEIVHAQVRLIDTLLTNQLGKTLGLADHDVVTLDPAVGTGTYLLGVIDHALGKVQAQQGKGAVPGQATALAGNIYGFEKLVGPFAVSELRVTRALQDRGATLPKNGTNIYLTDTLESPHAQPPQHVMGWAQREFAEQHKRATQVKAKVPVIVCLGNPPYDRHEAVDASAKSLSRFGGWVRFGDPIGEQKMPKKGKKARAPRRRDPMAVLKERERRSILHAAFVDPVIRAGHGGDLKNLYNLYVYFWRWALWKVFEHKTASGPGVVSFISASSYLDGDAFCGMREHMRRLCDEIWILDLGGEGRGTRKSENVFAIQTPVAIAVAVRYGKAKTDTPAKVRFVRIDGTRNEKLKALDAIHDFAGLQWEDCPDVWQAPFRPAGAGQYFDWPLLTALFPWQHSGVECKRTWPIAPDKDVLRQRWRALLKGHDRAAMFRETGDRTVTGKYKVALTPGASSKPIADLPANAPSPPVVRCAFRSFDRQYLVADARLMSRPRPDLWRAHGDRQTYVTSLFNHPLGFGPALTTCCEIPDRHHLRGSYGGKDVIPLYRDVQGKEANILPGLADLLARAYGQNVTPEDLLAYVYGVLGQPAFTERYADELGTRELRVPLTKHAALFAQVRGVGAKLLWLHTYGQRFVPKVRHAGQLPKGKARCTRPVPGDAADYPEKYEYNGATKTLHVGDGEFAPVTPGVYDFEVSGLKVVQSWLAYRMKNPKGKKSSPLDEINPKKWPSDFTTELLELLWVLEATIAQYPQQAKLLEAVVKGSLFKAHELPSAPDAARKPPKLPSAKGLFEDAEGAG